MSSVFEYCGVCLQDDTKVIAAQVIQQVPLCKGCVLAYGEENDVLRDAREFLRDLEPPKEESATPPPEHPCACACGEMIPGGDEFAVGHPKKVSKKIDKYEVFDRGACDCGKPAGHSGRCTGTKLVTVDNARVADRGPAKPEVEGRLITSKEVREGLAMREDGFGYAVIARQFNLGYGHVYNALKHAEKNGVDDSWYDNPHGKYENPPTAKVSVDRSITQREIVTVQQQTPLQSLGSFMARQCERGKHAKCESEICNCECHKAETTGSREIKQGRVQAILIPGAKPLHHVKLNGAIAQAVWDSLTMQEKYELFDVEGMWDSYDVDMRMMTVAKVLLIYPGDIPEVKPNDPKRIV